MIEGKPLTLAAERAANIKSFMIDATAIGIERSDVLAKETFLRNAGNLYM